MKIVIGNLVFAAIVLGMYFTGFVERQEFLRSVVFILLAFVAGTLLGYWLSRPASPVPPTVRTTRYRRSRGARPALTPSPFDRIVE